MMRAVLLALSVALAGSPALAEPARAPDFTLPGRGAPVNLQTLRGKVVYLDFWASWCAPCKRSFPWMGALQSRFGAAGLQVVAVNLDQKQADAELFLAATPAQFLVAYDPAGATARQFAVKGMPSSVLIGRDGTILQRHMGFTSETPAALEAEIAQALKTDKESR